MLKGSTGSVREDRDATETHDVALEDGTLVEIPGREAGFRIVVQGQSYVRVSEDGAGHSVYRRDD